MTILAKTRNTISLVNAISMLLYFSIQPQGVQTCRAASSHASPPNVPVVHSGSEKSYTSIYKYITATAAPIISSTQLDILKSTPQTATSTYFQHTVSSFTEHTVSSSIGAEVDGYGQSSTTRLGIARSCLDQSKEFYDLCFRTIIVRAPHLAVRFAGRSLRAGETCRMLALRHLERCKKLFVAAS